MKQWFRQMPSIHKWVIACFFMVMVLGQQGLAQCEDPPISSHPWPVDDVCRITDGVFDDENFEWTCTASVQLGSVAHLQVFRIGDIDENPCGSQNFISDTLTASEAGDLPGTLSGPSQCAPLPYFPYCVDFESDQLNTVGSYTKSIIIDDAHTAEGSFDDHSLTFTWVVNVKPAAPPIEDTVCPRGGCSSCCSNSGVPLPDLRQWAIWPQPALPIIGGLGGAGGGGSAGGGSGGGSSSGKQGKCCSWELWNCCDGLYIRAWDNEGRCYRFGPYDNAMDPPIAVGGITYNLTVQTDGSVTIADPKGSTIHMSNPTGDGGFVSYSDTVTAPSGNVTQFGRLASGAISSVTLPTGSVINYEHNDTSFPMQVTRIINPDNRYTTASYVSASTNSAAAGQLAEVVHYDTNDQPVSTTTYDYYTSSDGSKAGFLKSYHKGNRTVGYDYTFSGSGSTTKIIVTEDSTDPVTQTVYDYTSFDTTTVTRRKTAGGDSPGQDEVTTYQYYMNGSSRAYLKRVTDPYGTVTFYNIPNYTSPGPTLGQVTYIEVRDNAGSFLQKTNYAYDSATGAVTQVQRVDSSETPLRTENTTYYPNTSWVQSHQDARECWTHYVRERATWLTFWPSRPPAQT